MKPETKAAALRHAAAEAPREACGLLLIRDGKEEYLPCRNLSSSLGHFVMDPLDFVGAEEAGDVTAVVHSHPNTSAKASQADLVSCEASGLPWFIVSVSSGVWERIEPSGYKAPLIGRTWVHGVTDCYSLIRDWYREHRSIDLPEYERDEEWWKNGDNLYLDHFEEAGFAPLSADEAYRPGDCILMQIHSKVVNHAAVYLGRDTMMHHVMKRLSSREIYGGYWKKNTRLVVRHRGAA